MATARSGCAGAGFGNAAYVTGGIDANSNVLASVSVYTAATGAWTAGAPMRTARYYHAAAVLGGFLYVSGGADVINNNILASVEGFGPWHECNAAASGGCTVCPACCHDYIDDGPSC